MHKTQVELDNRAMEDRRTYYGPDSAFPLDVEEVFASCVQGAVSDGVPSPFVWFYALGAMFRRDYLDTNEEVFTSESRRGAA
jgi:hypothetical protein